MMRRLFPLLFILFACGGSQDLPISQKTAFTEIHIKETGGFTGGTPQIAFYADGRLLKNQVQTAILSAEKQRDLQQIAPRIMALEPISFNGQSLLSRSIKLISESDTIQYYWSIEDPTATSHNQVWRKLHQLSITE